METHPLTARNWLIVALVSVVLGALFIAPYLGVLALAALTAFLFYGTYERLVKKMRQGAAASLTILFSMAVVLVPVLLVGIFTIFQLGALATTITASFGGDFTSLPAVVQEVVTAVNTVAAQLGSGEQLITAQGVLEFAQTTLPSILRAITAFVTGFVGSIPLTIILVLMYLFLFYEFLVYGKKVITSIVALSPFQPDVTRMYLARVGLMANAMAKGELLMSVGIGLLEALVLAVFFGWWDFLLLMTVAFSLLNLIPLGAGMLAYPLILIAMLLGNVWPGIGALIAITAVSNLESFIRPRLIPKSITLTNGLTMLAAFSGIALYGLLGVIYGPIIMIIIVTSVQMYLDYYQKLPKHTPKARRKTT